MKKAVYLYFLLAVLAVTVLSFPSFSVSDDAVTDAADIENVFENALSFYGPSEVNASNCEVRITRFTGSSCLDPSHRKSVDIVHDFGEFSHFHQLPPFGDTVSFILYFDDVSLDILEKATALLTDESARYVDRLKDTTRFLLGRMSSGTSTHSCSGDVQFLPGISDNMSLFVDEFAAPQVSKWITSKIETCGRL